MHPAFNLAKVPGDSLTRLVFLWLRQCSGPMGEGVAFWERFCATRVMLTMSMSKDCHTAENEA